MKCKNCQTEFTGNFCNHCGQNSNVGRINLNYVVNDLPNSIFSLDRGFFFTLKELFVKPAATIRAFIDGQQKPYYKPLAYFLVIASIYVLLAYLLDKNTFFDDAITGWKGALIDNNESADLKIFNWIKNNQVYLTLLFLPLFSLATYLAFIKSKYNYFEHLVINLYISAQQIIIYSVLSFIFPEQSSLMALPMPIVIFYNFWVFKNIFKGKSYIKNLGLIILMYLILIFIIFILMLLVVLTLKLIG